MITVLTTQGRRLGLLLVQRGAAGAPPAPPVEAIPLPPRPVPSSEEEDRTPALAANGVADVTDRPGSQEPRS